MNNKPKSLNTRGLLAAAVALASGSALAEQAGRVSFVTGDVRATALDGTVRNLTRGDIISTGDKINTGSGRLQLRFSDGGFVSLQPNSVFGVDQYLYANKPPEEASVFFSLLQGGMRTITGAIGKVNKQSYKVRTPVATIGIRGTEYRARVDAKRVIVSVGSGFVNVANEHGNITAGAGQNIEASLTNGPRMTNEEPDVNASGPEGEREQQVAEDDSESERQQRQAEQLLMDGNNEVMANLLDPDGTPHPVPTHVDIPNSLPNGSGYSLTTTDASGSVTTLSGLTATFDPSTGAITSLIQGSPQETAPPQIGASEITPVITGPTFKPGTLKFVNNARFGNIGFGEITDGIAEANDFSSILPSSVGANEFYTYMMAVPATGYIGGKASYSLQGGTLARVNRSDNSGTLDRFNLDLNLLTGSADVDMLVKMADSNIGDISVTGSNVYLGSSSAPNGFSLSSGLSTSSTGSFCAGCGGCSTDISGMFVAGGSQVAASYSIDGSLGGNSSNITGYAALGQISSEPEPVTESGYSLLTQDMGEGGTYAGTISASFDSSSKIVELSDDNNCEGPCLFEPGTLQTISQGQSTYLRWGELTDGTAASGNMYGLPETAFGGDGMLGNDEFVSYIIGKTLSVGAIHGAATASYSLLGNGSTPVRYVYEGPGAAATLSQFDMTFNLFAGTVDVDMLVNGVDNGVGNIETVTVTGRNITLSMISVGLDDSDNLIDSYGGSFGLGSSGLVTSSSENIFCETGCDTNIFGFLAGDSREIGASYAIYGRGSLKGVAALGLNSTPIAGNNLPLKDGAGYILVADRGQNVILTDGNPYSSSNSYVADFDASGNLLNFNTIFAGEGNSVTLDSGAASHVSAESGSYKTLHWGRLTSTGAAVTYNGETVTLGDSQSLTPASIHYVVGTITDPNEWRNLNQGYAGGTATYSVVGQTNPTNTAGTVGTLNSSTRLTLHLDSSLPTLDIDLDVSMGADNYVAKSTGNSLAFLGSGPAAATFNTSNFTTTVNGGACGGSGCNTSVHGFFSGSQAQQAGMSYSIVDTGTANTTITGAAALTMNSLVLPPQNP